eukprot:scaffold694_cov338-Pavlova_lutheri.AAC.28
MEMDECEEGRVERCGHVWSMEGGTSSTAYPPLGRFGNDGGNGEPWLAVPRTLCNHTRPTKRGTAPIEDGPCNASTVGVF